MYCLFIQKEILADNCTASPVLVSPKLNICKDDENQFSEKSALTQKTYCSFMKVKL